MNSFLIPGVCSLADLVTGLPETFTVEWTDEQAGVLSLYDTFDWRLYRSGKLLSHLDTCLTLQSLDLCTELLTLEDCQNVPRFVSELPPLEPYLAKLVGLRALLPLWQGQVRISKAKVCDDIGKILAQLTHFEFDKQPEGLAVVFCFALRGYEAEAATLAQRFEDQGLQPFEEPFRELFMRAGLAPMDDSAKGETLINPDMPAHLAACLLFRHQLALMNSTLQGIREDWDTEFLHDFRVAVRRTRSGLGQIKGVFETEATRTVRENMALLGKLTNELRDLDVHLLSRKEYLDRIPGEFVPDLELCFNHLQKLRGQAQHRLVVQLDSGSVRTILEDWSHLLAQPASDQAAKATEPIGAHASKIIFRRFSKVQAMGLSLTDASPDTEFHELRIECKKLRYLLEFFSSLYPEELIGPTVRRLKQLQTVLGDFNDYHVQEKFLIELALNFKPPKARLAKVMLVLGMLIGQLSQRRISLKPVCLTRITQFLKPETETRFLSLKAFCFDGDGS